MFGGFSTAYERLYFRVDNSLQTVFNRHDEDDHRDRNGIEQLYFIYMCIYVRSYFCSKLNDGDIALRNEMAPKTLSQLRDTSLLLLLQYHI